MQSLMLKWGAVFEYDRWLLASGGLELRSSGTISSQSLKISTKSVAPGSCLVNSKSEIPELQKSQSRFQQEQVPGKDCYEVVSLGALCKTYGRNWG